MHDHSAKKTVDSSASKMKKQSQGNSEIQSLEEKNSLTKESDWTQYYSGHQFEQIESSACRTSIIDDYIKSKSGRIFELGCGGSSILARCAMFGWEVGGIDFNVDALKLIREYLNKGGYENMNLICGDIFSYECSQLESKYDILASFGFLEHFKDPQSIISKWKEILKPDGIVISCIPNLFSINAYIFKQFDHNFWSQHIAYDPSDMDQFHIKAGLSPLKKAHYCGQYNINMLIPWDKINKLIGNDFFLKVTKNLAHYSVGKLFGLLPNHNMMWINSFVIGVYMNQPNSDP